MTAKQRVFERRITPTQVELREHEGRKYIEGYAAIFNKRSQDLGGFVEIVSPSAFNKTINEADVRALFNHNPSLILGRNKAGTLDLALDPTGLYYRILPGTRSYERDLVESLERGDVDKSSFAFMTVRDDWAIVDDYPLRSLLDLILVDVSPVTYPAYEDTVATLVGGRSFSVVGGRMLTVVDNHAYDAGLCTLSQRSGIDLAQLNDSDAISRAIRGEPLSTEAGPESTSEAAATSTSDEDKWASIREARLREADAILKGLQTDV